MKNLALPRIRNMTSYAPPLSGRRSFRGLRLDFNERTLPPSTKVKSILQQFLTLNTLQLYPEYGDLERILANYAGVGENQIMITNGSDQAIDLIFRTFTDTTSTVILPTPSFAMFYQAAQINGNTIIEIPYNKKDLSFPLTALLRAVNESVKLIVLCNPNNPTGTSIDVETIKIIAKKAPNTIIMVDEAYVEYANITATPLIQTYPNIIVLRTLSKAFGIPSLRIGYIIAANMYINELLKVRGPYDINTMAYVAAVAALKDKKSARTYANQIMKKAKPMVEAFFKKNNIMFYQSSGNFILYKPVKENEESILKENGILVRPQYKKYIENTLRLTIGTPAQMKQFMIIYQNVILSKQIKTKRSKKGGFIA